MSIAPRRAAERESETVLGALVALGWKNWVGIALASISAFIPAWLIGSGFAEGWVVVACVCLSGAFVAVVVMVLPDAVRTACAVGMSAFLLATGFLFNVFGQPLTVQDRHGSELIPYYYSIDGSNPRLEPDCLGLLSVCLGHSIDTVLAKFGPEANRYAGIETETLNREWQVGPGIHFTVESDYVDSVTQITAAVEDDGDVRVALPEGIRGKLVLGGSTMGEARVVFEPYPPTVEVIPAEGFTLVDYVWKTGPEGSVKVTMTHSIDWSGSTVITGDESEDDWVKLVDSGTMTAFSVGYAN